MYSHFLIGKWENNVKSNTSTIRESIYFMSILSSKRIISPYLCRAERDRFTPVCFGPCYKSWFQMYEKKTSCYSNSSMLLWRYLRMWGNPLGNVVSTREEVTRSSLQRCNSGYSIGHWTTAQDAWLRKLKLKIPIYSVFLPVPSHLSWPPLTQKWG